MSGEEPLRFHKRKLTHIVSWILNSVGFTASEFDNCIDTDEDEYLDDDEDKGYIPNYKDVEWGGDYGDVTSANNNIIYEILHQVSN